jgi:hypothetical protein
MEDLSTIFCLAADRLNNHINLRHTPTSWRDVGGEQWLWQARLASTLPDTSVAQSGGRFREEALVKLLTVNEWELVYDDKPMKRESGKLE